MVRAGQDDKLISLQGDFWKTHQPGHASLAIKNRGFQLSSIEGKTMENNFKYKITPTETTCLCVYQCI